MSLPRLRNIVDSHNHTYLCNHAEDSPEKYVEHAIKIGLSGIVFTDHCPLPSNFNQGYRMAPDQLDMYTNFVLHLKQQYSSSIKVLLGMESEFYPGYTDYFKDLHEKADFDYVFCSIHSFYIEYIENHLKDKNFTMAIDTYFGHIAEAAESGLYDAIGHIDIIKNDYPDKWNFKIAQNTIKNCLDRIAKTGVAIELNTSGMYKTIPEYMPSEDFLNEICKRDIPITLGSDSHSPERVGDLFDESLLLLKEIGVNQVYYYKNRKAVSCKL